MARLFLSLVLLVCMATPSFAQPGHWTGPDRSGALESLIEAVRQAPAHGLRSEDYRLTELEEIDPAVPSSAADALADQVFETLANDLLTGRTNPRVIDPDWPFPPRTADIAALRALALETGESHAVLEWLSPRHPDYRLLQAELAYWLPQADPDWLPIRLEGAALSVGDSGPVIHAIRQRLHRLGGFPPRSLVVPIPAGPFSFERSLDWPEFDPDMAEAVGWVQRRARLNPDERIGPETLAWLNRTPSDRVATLRANLERLRWLPEDFGAAHIAVNIPDFTLEVLEDGEVIRRHNVIVGRISRPTPILSAHLSHLIVNPWWETPYSLAVRDELPLFRRDPDAVARLGFQVLDRSNTVVDGSTIDWTSVSAADFPYRLRQAPGPANALGVVKLIFPNPHSTFLHDTPGRHRFAELPRAFSSGCVRVEDAVGLAVWAAQFAEPDRERPPLLDLVAAGAETRLDMVRDVRVHFLYRTAFGDGTSSVRMVRDLYERDPIIIEALDVPTESSEIRPPLPRPGPLADARDGNGYAPSCPD
jgi:murein L,D-transpeptidase YcbB/YkuD